MKFKNTESSPRLKS